MELCLAAPEDLEWLCQYDHHASRNELRALIGQGRIWIARMNGEKAGWLRWNLFWDNTPFMNMLYVLEHYRQSGIGRALVATWERECRAAGYSMVLTSTQSDEYAQHFYRRIGYKDCGSLILPGEVLEIIFCKQLD